MSRGARLGAAARAGADERAGRVVRAGWPAPGAGRRALRGAGRRAGEPDVPGSLRAVSAAVRAGVPPGSAWAAAGFRVLGGEPRWPGVGGEPRWPGVGAGGRPWTLGTHGGEAAVERARTSAAIRAASLLATRTGAPLATVLDAVAAALDAEAEVAARRRAALAGPVASARLLALLPLTGPVLGFAVGADPIGVLADGGAGTGLLLAGVGLAALGRVWTARLVAAAARAGADPVPARCSGRGPGAGPGAAARPVSGTGRRARALVGVPAADHPDVELGVVLELLAAAAAAGASVPDTLGAIGRAAGGARGPALGTVGRLLALGAGWSEAWAGAPHDLRPVAEALRPAWLDGAGPVGPLRGAADRVRRERRASADQAAGRLGVRLLLPLALCHLPAFVLVGLVPVLVSLARSVFGAPM